MPATTNYQLNSYGFGSGGTAGSSTSTYALEGISGEVSGQTSSTSTYSAKPGFIETQQANVPKVTLSNPASYYDKLKFVIDQQSNPSDALYALQISTTSDFSSNVNYVKSDLTIGAILTLADYQTYAAWGGASGANIIGLSANTTYYLRAKATQGKFTESGYGPSSSAATVAQQLSFCLYTAANCVGGGSTVSFTGVVPDTITDGSNNIKVDFATNANSGGKVYIYSLNAGLKSPAASDYLVGLSSPQVDLSSASEGFGAQIASVSQSTGGPLSKVSPYDGSAQLVGRLNTTVSELLNSANPLTGGTGSTTLKLLASKATPSANDYADTLTLIAAASF
jgi:hypothetical protein